MLLLYFYATFYYATESFCIISTLLYAYFREIKWKMFPDQNCIKFCFFGLSKTLSDLIFYLDLVEVEFAGQVVFGVVKLSNINVSNQGMV